MNSPTNREVADELAMRYGPAMSGGGKVLADAIESALAAAFARGRAAGEESMREAVHEWREARKAVSRASIDGDDGAFIPLLTRLSNAEAFLAALPLSAPAKQEATDAQS